MTARRGVEEAEQSRRKSKFRRTRFGLVRLHLQDSPQWRAELLRENLCSEEVDVRRSGSPGSGHFTHYTAKYFVGTTIGEEYRHGIMDEPPCSIGNGSQRRRSADRPAVAGNPWTKCFLDGWERCRSPRPRRRAPTMDSPDAIVIAATQTNAVQRLRYLQTLYRLTRSLPDHRSATFSPRSIRTTRTGSSTLRT